MSRTAAVPTPYPQRPGCGRAFKYGTIYGMHKTTVYLPPALKAALTGMSATTGRSEADLIREAIANLTGGDRPLTMRLPLFESDEPISERVDELLAKGFGLD